MLLRAKKRWISHAHKGRQVTVACDVPARLAGAGAPAQVVGSVFRETIRYANLSEGGCSSRLKIVENTPMTDNVTDMLLAQLLLRSPPDRPHRRP